MAIKFGAPAAPAPKRRPAEQIMEGLREALAVAKGEAKPYAVHTRPGRPPSGKVRVTMLLQPETVAAFKATGKGWQARISAVLDRNAP